MSATRRSKYTISIGKAIGGMEFVCCTEVVRLLESPLLKVSLLYKGDACALYSGPDPLN